MHSPCRRGERVLGSGFVLIKAVEKRETDARRPNRKMVALVLLLLSSGMRLGKALKLGAADLDFKHPPARATIRVEITKGGKQRVVLMTDEV
jgi:integrase